MNLKFRKIEKNESDAIAEWLSSDRWPYFLGHTPTKAEVLKRIEEGSFFGEGDQVFWVLNPNEEKIAFIELNELDDLAPMFSIRFKSEYRGKGLGKAAVDWISRYVFESFPEIRRIEAQTREDNIRMRKLFNKCGYVKEAYYRFASPTEDGGRVASIAYGILREDWESGRLTKVNWEKDSFYCD